MDQINLRAKYELVANCDHLDALTTVAEYSGYITPAASAQGAKPLSSGFCFFWGARFRDKFAFPHVSFKTRDNFFYRHLRAVELFCAHLRDFLFSCANASSIVHRNTPAMPLTEAHFGGFFVFGARL